MVRLVVMGLVRLVSRLVMVGLVVDRFVSLLIVDISNIALVAINVVLDSLQATVGKLDMVLSLSVLAVALLALAKLGAVVGVVDIIAILIMGGLVGVLVMVPAPVVGLLVVGLVHGLVAVGVVVHDMVGRLVVGMDVTVAVAMTVTMTVMVSVVGFCHTDRGEGSHHWDQELWGEREGVCGFKWIGLFQKSTFILETVEEMSNLNGRGR